jgi:hypothetical protein
MSCAHTSTTYHCTLAPHWPVADGNMTADSGGRCDGTSVPSTDEARDTSCYMCGPHHKGARAPVQDTDFWCLYTAL